MEQKHFLFLKKIFLNLLDQFKFENVDPKKIKIKLHNTHEQEDYLGIYVGNILVCKTHIQFINHNSLTNYLVKKKIHCLRMVLLDNFIQNYKCMFEGASKQYLYNINIDDVNQVNIGLTLDYRLCYSIRNKTDRMEIQDLHILMTRDHKVRAACGLTNLPTEDTVGDALNWDREKIDDIVILYLVKTNNPELYELLFPDFDINLNLQNIEDLSNRLSILEMDSY